MINTGGYMPYKAAVMKIDNEDETVHVYVQLRNGEIIDKSIGISDFDGHYKHFTNSDIGLAWLYIQDNTEKYIEIETKLDDEIDEIDFDGIFFWLNDVVTVSVYDKDNDKVSIETLIDKEELVDVLSELFDNELEYINPNDN